MSYSWPLMITSEHLLLTIKLKLRANMLFSILKFVVIMKTITKIMFHLFNLMFQIQF